MKSRHFALLCYVYYAIQFTYRTFPSYNVQTDCEYYALDISLYGKVRPLIIYIIYKRTKCVQVQKRLFEIGTFDII